MGLSDYVVVVIAFANMDKKAIGLSISSAEKDSALTMSHKRFNCVVLFLTFE